MSDHFIGDDGSGIRALVQEANPPEKWGGDVIESDWEFIFTDSQNAGEVVDARRFFAVDYGGDGFFGIAGTFGVNDTDTKQLIHVFEADEDEVGGLTFYKTLVGWDLVAHDAMFWNQIPGAGYVIVGQSSAEDGVYGEVNVLSKYGVLIGGAAFEGEDCKAVVSHDGDDFLVVSERDDGQSVVRRLSIENVNGMPVEPGVTPPLPSTELELGADTQVSGLACQSGGACVASGSKDGIAAWFTFNPEADLAPAACLP